MSKNYTIIRLGIRGGDDENLGIATREQVEHEMAELGDFAVELPNGIIKLDPETGTMAIPHEGPPYNA
jgi:hypothetical protein